MKEDLQNKKGMFRKGNQQEELAVLDIFARVGQRVLCQICRFEIRKKLCFLTRLKFIVLVGFGRRLQ